ncbi:MAG: UDP-N-acetylmuramate dehydrogenase, partial [Candidatus Omnitrophota bacterium]
ASDALAARCAFDGVCGRVLTDEPLNKHTTFKIGGPARFWIEPSDSEDLRRVLAGCRHSGKRVCFFGLGSNLLVSDEGFEGVAIRLSAKAFTDVRLADGRTVVCGAGMPLAHFIRFGSENCLGGFEFLAGIPGTVGGAVLMNAGSRDRWIESLVESVTVMTMDGQIVTRPRASLEFAYRRSGLSDCVILEVVFKLSEAEAAATREQLEAFRQHRIQTQDTISPSAGCVFKNPSNGVSCGKLIQEAGLKGHRIGDAEVSQKHANFIVNRGQASARDVKALCQVVRQSIRERFGIDLEQEIKFVE